MNKTPTKQYFADVTANQDSILHFIRLMPNNITTCKLINVWRTTQLLKILEEVQHND